VSAFVATGVEPIAGTTLFLHAGQILAGVETRSVHTIVGSCVAICLFDAHGRHFGINHYLLPTMPRTGAAAGRALSYGDIAVPELLARMRDHGSVAGSLEAKVFGGAKLVGDALTVPLGLRNVELAFDLLRAAGIPIVAHDVGGSRGRKLLLNPRDGSVLVKLL
jgi:chemotaxis protein CheD